MGRAIFRTTMPLKKFKQLTRILRFDDKMSRDERREQDKLAPIREMWEDWVKRLPLMYRPDTNITVDESLVGFRGRCPFKQYMPKKPAKYGIKIWAACDANSSYCLNMQVYTGKPPGVPHERNLGRRIVLEMMDGFQGHIVICDNFFTSYALGIELLNKKMRMIGTIRRNKPELPSALTIPRGRAKFSSLFAFTETHTIVSYCPRKNKNVLLMSTVHEDAAVSEREDRKPEMILSYNRTKGGVDNLDKIVATYTCRRKTARWPMAVFYNMLDVLAYNAFVIWREINPSWGQGDNYMRRHFLQDLGRALVFPFIQSRRHIPRTPASLQLLRKVQECDEEAVSSTSGPSRAGPSRAGPTPTKRRRCRKCLPHDLKTGIVCSKCHIPICKGHSIVMCDNCDN
uniref:PiggyBac transposable element-derived protein domain-containing protein n=1 Tax=Cyprinus carpio carpio TaxID=630221 RepID=A0A9J7X7T1_CYPCA